MVMSSKGMEGFALLNIAHQDRRPRCERCAFRLLGVFSSEAHAREHAEQNLAGQDCSLHMLKVGIWTPMMLSEESPDGLAHLAQLVEKHGERLKSHAEEFSSNVKNQQTGEVSPLPPQTTRATSSLEPLPGLTEVGNLSRLAEVRLQRFAVISILPDYTKPGEEPRQEPGLAVWAVTDSEADAKALIKEKLAVNLRDIHLDVVSMYEWLFPTAIDLSALQEEYRDDKLDEIMRHRKEEGQRVADFRKTCEQEGREVPSIELGDPSSDEAPAALPPSEPPQIANLDEIGEMEK